MKKILVSMVLTASLLCSFIVPAFATNETSTAVPSDARDAIELVISTIAFEKESYGYADVDFSKIQIGEVIPTYTLFNDKSIQATAEIFYPVLDEFDNLIALAVVCSDKENETYAFLSSELVPALNKCLGTNENVALVYDDRGVYCWNGTSATLLAREDLAESVAGRASLSDITTEELSVVNTNQVEAICDLGLDFDSPSTIANGDEYVYISVPLKQQPSGSMWCWAACMASILQFEKGGSYTTNNIGNKYTNSTSTGASITNLQNWYKDYGLYYSLHNDVSYQKNYVTILNILGNRHPIHGDFCRSDYKARHGAVIRGINTDAKSFSVMDPTTGTYRTGKIENSSASKGMFVLLSATTNQRFILDKYLYK